MFNRHIYIRLVPARPTGAHAGTSPADDGFTVHHTWLRPLKALLTGGVPVVSGTLVCGAFESSQL